MSICIYIYIYTHINKLRFILKSPHTKDINDTPPEVEFGSQGKLAAPIHLQFRTDYMDDGTNALKKGTTKNLFDKDVARRKRPRPDHGPLS